MAQQEAGQTSFTTCFQPSRSANQPNSEGFRAVRPWPRWSWPTTAKPCSARKRAKESYRPMCSEMPWTSCTTPRGGPSGRHQAAATVWTPSLEGKVNSCLITMETRLLL